MKVLETERLLLRHLSAADPDDAAFILRLLNEPSFLANIGDRGVRTLPDARAYILNGPLASYERHGFGLFCVERRHDGSRIGICGLLKRDTLPDVDIGFAFLPEHWGQGHAIEAARAVMEWGRRVHGLTRIVAINAPGNAASVRVLDKLGMRLEGRVRIGEGDEVELRGWGEAPGTSGGASAGRAE